MKTIYMVCRSEKEEPHTLIQLVQTLFPECEVRIVCDSRSTPRTASEAMAALPPPLN